MSFKRLEIGRFLGATECLHRQDGIVVTGIAHGAPRALPRHTHEAAYFSLLLAGGYEEQFGRTRLAYRPGDVGFHPSHFEHSDRIGPAGGRFLAIELQPSWLARLHGYATPAAEAVLLTPEARRTARRILRECRTDQPARDLAVEALVLELLVETARRAPRAEARRPAWLDAVLARLEAEPFRGWTTATLAADAGVHPAHLARTLRRFEGRSLGAAALDVRVRAAARLLDDPARSLSDVADAAGFADQSHFTRRFRLATGATPGEYRRAGQSVRSASSGSSAAARRAGKSPAASETDSNTPTATAKLSVSKRSTP
jgi:AraC family transcriptional regulator